MIKCNITKCQGSCNSDHPFIRFLVSSCWELEWQVKMHPQPQSSVRKFVSCIDGCCSVALTVAATDWYIFTVMTAVNAPAVSASTFCYWPLVAGTIDILKPDSSSAFAVLMADMSTGPDLHIKKCVVITLFHLKCHNQFIRDEKSSAKTTYKRDIVKLSLLSCWESVQLQKDQSTV